MLVDVGKFQRDLDSLATVNGILHGGEPPLSGVSRTAQVRALLGVGSLPAMTGDARERGWWENYRDKVAPAHIEFIRYEAGAASIRRSTSGVIPGLVQPPEYARSG